MILLLPPTNEVWGKVMSLHLSVIHSVHRGEVVLFRWGATIKGSAMKGYHEEEIHEEGVP